MRRFKILLGTTFFILTLSLLITSGGLKPDSSLRPEHVTSMDSVVTVSTTAQEKTLFDENEVELYRQFQKELNNAVKTYFERAIAAGDIVGAGVSIVRGDSIVISKGFGRKTAGVGGEVNGETVFRLGSLSKGFAGVLAADLKHEGKLKWEDRVSDYIPGFELGGPDNTDKITLANILSHTAGTPYHSYTNLVEAGLSMEAIAQRFTEVVPISEPGAMYSYQNAMFALCGVMMRKATGTAVTKSLQNRFFNPLGMCSTTMDYETLAKVENIAKPHVRSRRGWKSTRLTNSYHNAIVAGGINASAHDMAKWMRFLLGHNPELMGKAVLQEVFTPFIEIKGGNKYYYRWPGHLASYYGFGWRIHKFMEKGTNEEKTIWHHGGSVNNYRNEIAVYPEADLGICVLLNCNSKLARTVIPDLYQIVEDLYNKRTPPKFGLEESHASASPAF